MTQTTNKIFDEVAKLLTNAAGAAGSVRNEVDHLFKAQAERILNDLDVVQREEYEAVREMAVKARQENEALAKRVDVLEAALAKKAPAKRKPAKPRKA